MSVAGGGSLAFVGHYQPYVQTVSVERRSSVAKRAYNSLHSPTARAARRRLDEWVKAQRMLQELGIRPEKKDAEPSFVNADFLEGRDRLPQRSSGEK